MNIEKLLEAEGRRREDRNIDKAPSAGNLGSYMTTKQAAKELGVSVSRIRQLIREKRLSSKNPEIGRRDHLLKISEVRAFKRKPRERTGRPPESEDAKSKK